jgi:hypothetical protein
MGQSSRPVLFSNGLYFFVSVTRSKQPPDEMPPVLKKLADILEKEDRLAEDYYDHVGRKYLW